MNKSGVRSGCGQGSVVVADTLPAFTLTFVEVSGQPWTCDRFGGLAKKKGLNAVISF
jgi:hypothetical protein